MKVTIVEFLTARYADEANFGYVIEVFDRTTAQADLAAKRRIVEEYAARHNDADLMLGPAVERQRQWNGLHFAVRILASVYADHPDYREEWKP